MYTIEIDTIEKQQTEKIETEVSDDDRIRAYRCTQHHPGCPSGASPSHNIIYYSLPHSPWLGIIKLLIIKLFSASELL
jgi:hypothetical protein